jgi:ankyrin repeat protein
METILALLSVNVNVNTRVQDTFGKTPLHLAVEAGNEMVVRNLVIYFNHFKTILSAANFAFFSHFFA